MKKPIVLLTRPTAQNDDITPKILRLGCEVITEPMLEIIPVKSRGININKQTGLIFTSVRAAENITTKHESLLSPIYTVGYKTTEYLKLQGYTNIVHTTENSEEMQQYFNSNKKTVPEQLIHICGEDVVINFTITNTIIEKHITYKAKKTKVFTENLPLYVQNIDVILFYSARSAQNFVKLIKQYDLQDKCASINILCISTRTVKYTKDVHWNNIYIAQKPNNISMMDMLQNILETKVMK